MLTGRGPAGNCTHAIRAQKGSTRAASISRNLASDVSRAHIASASTSHSTHTVLTPRTSYGLSNHGRLAGVPRASARRLCQVCFRYRRHAFNLHHPLLSWQWRRCWHDVPTNCAAMTANHGAACSTYINVTTNSLAHIAHTNNLTAEKRHM